MTAVAVFFWFHGRSAGPLLGVGNNITYIFLICGQPILVDLSHTIQPFSRVTLVLYAYDDRLASFRNSVFPASDFRKHTRAMEFHVIFLAIVRLRTNGLDISFVCNDISGELLGGYLVVSFPHWEKRTHIVVGQPGATVDNIYGNVGSSRIIIYKVCATRLILWPRDECHFRVYIMGIDKLTVSLYNVRSLLVLGTVI